MRAASSSGEMGKGPATSGRAQNSMNGIQPKVTDLWATIPHGGTPLCAHESPSYSVRIPGKPEGKGPLQGELTWVS